MTTKALATQESQLAIHQQQPPSLLAILQGVTQGAVTVESVAITKEIFAMMREQEARDAEKAFAAAMVAVKEDLAEDPIQACKAVPDNNGVTRYKYAPLEEIDKKLAPIALRHKLTYSFAEAPSEPGKVTKVCIVQHNDGHSKSHPVTVRVGNGPPKASECQSDGAAGTYAKRQALLDAFGIVAEKDTDGANDDARMEGHPITAQQSESLESRCLATKTNRKAFLKFAGVKDGGTFSDIMSSRYADCDQELREREGKPAAAGEKDADGNYKF